MKKKVHLCLSLFFLLFLNRHTMDAESIARFVRDHARDFHAIRDKVLTLRDFKTQADVTTRLLGSSEPNIKHILKMLFTILHRNTQEFPRFLESLNGFKWLNIDAEITTLAVPYLNFPVLTQTSLLEENISLKIFQVLKDCEGEIKQEVAIKMLKWAEKRPVEDEDEDEKDTPKSRMNAVLLFLATRDIHLHWKEATKLKVVSLQSPPFASLDLVTILTKFGIIVIAERRTSTYVPGEKAYKKEVMAYVSAVWRVARVAVDLPVDHFRTDIGDYKKKIQEYEEELTDVISEERDAEALEEHFQRGEFGQILEMSKAGTFLDLEKVVRSLVDSKSSSEDGVLHVTRNYLHDALWNVTAAPTIEAFVSRMVDIFPVVKRNIVWLVLDVITTPTTDERDDSLIKLMIRKDTSESAEQDDDENEWNDILVRQQEKFQNRWLKFDVDVLAYLRRHLSESRVAKLLKYPKCILLSPDLILPSISSERALQILRASSKFSLSGSQFEKIVEWLVQRHTDADAKRCFETLLRNSTQPTVDVLEVVRVDHHFPFAAFSDMILEHGNRTGLYVIPDAFKKLDIKEWNEVKRSVELVWRTVQAKFPSLPGSRLDLVYGKFLVPQNELAWFFSLPAMHQTLISFFHTLLLKNDHQLVIQGSGDTVSEELEAFRSLTASDIGKDSTREKFHGFFAGSYNRVIPLSQTHVLRLSRRFFPEGGLPLIHVTTDLLHELIPSTNINHPTIIGTTNLVVLDVHTVDTSSVARTRTRARPQPKPMSLSVDEWSLPDDHKVEKLIVSVQPKMCGDLHDFGPILVRSNETSRFKDWQDNREFLSKLTDEQKTAFMSYMNRSENLARQIRRLLVQIMCGLWLLHRHGIVHCDFKPDNVLIGQVEAREGGEFHIPVKLADFGLCRIKPVSMFGKRIAQGFGTLSYMSPQMLNLEAESKSGRFLVSDKEDCWALGVLIDALLTKNTWNTISLIQDGGYQQVLDKVKRWFSGNPLAFASSRFGSYHDFVRRDTDLLQDIKQLVNGFLKFDSRERMNLSEALKISSLERETKEMFPGSMFDQLSRDGKIANVNMFFRHVVWSVEEVNSSLTLSPVPDSTDLTPLFFVNNNFVPLAVAMEALTLYQLTKSNKLSALVEMGYFMVAPNVLGTITTTSPVQVYLDILQSSQVKMLKTNWYEIAEPFLIDTIEHLRKDATFQEVPGNLGALVLYFARLAVSPRLGEILGIEVTPAHAGILFLRLLHDFPGKDSLSGAIGPETRTFYQHILGRFPPELITSEVVAKIHAEVLRMHKEFKESRGDRNRVARRSDQSTLWLVDLNKTSKRVREDGPEHSRDLRRRTGCHVTHCPFC